MNEHRAAPRRRMLKAGTIEFGGGGIDCTVQNISETGAGLEVATPLFIPDRLRFSYRAINSSGLAISFGVKKSGSASRLTKTTGPSGLALPVLARNEPQRVA
jgi:hypothetical protein